MVRIRHAWLVSVLALGLGAAACKKDEKKNTPATGETKPGDKPAEKPAEKPAGGGAAAAVNAANANASDLALLPKDSELVLGLNFAQLQKSTLWKKFVEPQLMKAENLQKLEEFKAKCGFDPLASIESVSMGLKGIGADKPDGVVVVHGIDKSKFSGCLEKMKPEMEKEGTTYTTEQDVTLIKSKDGDTAALAFAGGNTLVAVMGANANPAGVKGIVGGDSALKSSPAFVDMYGKINTGDSLWLLMNGNSKAFDKAAALGVKPKAVFGSVNVTDGLSLDLRVRLDTPDQAAQLATTANQQVAQFKSMVDKLDIGNDGADLKVGVAMSTQKLEALVQQLGGLIGGMGGMGGPGGGM